MSLFGKKEKEFVSEVEPSSGSVAVAALKEMPSPRAEAPVIALAQPQMPGATSIDATIRVKGEITGDEDIVVDGHVEGIINLNKSLVVGRRGSVEADVRAASVMIHGRVSGNIVADQKVEILATGRLEGNIKSPKIVIAEGAHFKGNVDMTGGSQGAVLGGSERKSIPFERKG